MKDHYKIYMHQCLDLARIALETGNPPVGALIVFEGKVIGKGIESGKSTGDITNHAEILAIRDAIANGYKDMLQAAIMYTTHEPCIMCSYLIRHHKIPEIVYGLAVPMLGGATSQFAVLSASDIPKWGKPPAVTGGICLEECNVLNEAFQKQL
ncbi:nucleoside deaminase [Taibaiella lutea]|uniref:Nucleoside deaminase n=1 Tax=Taibaiella lutea TaxID=2608001 RepID=A0A5M6CMS1_9BACT|nr:nucleoside deaminase [Taibaiella lutea]KAA5536327.1 nucleoside deaminase [Taibaiella lutea]